MKIFNFEYNDLHILYIKWYLIICGICIIIFILGKQLYKYYNIKFLNPSNNNNNTKLNSNKLNGDNTNNELNGDNTNNELNEDNTNNELNEDNTNNELNEDNTNNELNETKKEESRLRLKGDDIFYLYWTGGYDSTYRLCEMLIIEKKIVQPLYVSYSLDNDCPESEEKCNKLWVRRNRKQEKEAMNLIKRELFKNYPWCRKLLLPTIYITADIDDKLFNDYYDIKFYSDNLWPKKRSKHQYLFLTKYAYYHKIYVDTGILGIHNKTRFKEFLDENLIKIKENYFSPATNKNMTTVNYGFPKTLTQDVKLNDNNITSKHYMYYLRMSCYGKTKKDLLLNAKKHGFDNILTLTWSCWFPNAKTGKQCGKCPMCRERIVKHPNK